MELTDVVCCDDEEVDAAGMEITDDADETKDVDDMDEAVDVDEADETDVIDDGTTGCALMLDDGRGASDDDERCSTGSEDADDWYHG